MGLFRPVRVEAADGGWSLWWLQNYPTWAWFVVLVLVGWDDVLEHAFGLWTPLDQTLAGRRLRPQAAHAVALTRVALIFSVSFSENSRTESVEIVLFDPTATSSV